MLALVSGYIPSPFGFEISRHGFVLYFILLHKHKLEFENHKIMSDYCSP